MRARHLGSLIGAGCLAGMVALAEPAVTNRPKIGVVLGGGGALGFAHIGVLKVLEAERIPIAYIGGTSMGAIISGLYAAGMSPDDIQQFLEGLDWWDVLNDRTPRRELEFRRKQEDLRYLVELGWRDGGLHGGRGAAAGQKFNNLLQDLTLRSAGITNFNALPIPYRAVATDLQTGTRRVLAGGNLATAMRASMAVPGGFTPVEWEGHLLVDGGVVDNIPVDVVRDLGAEIIIAVDVGGALVAAKKASSFDSLGDVLGRTYHIMQRPEQEAQLRQADVAIVPPLVGFTASQFERVAEIIPIGYAAATGMVAALRPYAVDATAYADYLARQRRPTPADVPVGAVAIVGNRRVDARVAAGRVRSRPGHLDLEQVRRDLLHLHGLGEFEQVRYTIQPRPDGSNTLAYVLEEKDWGPHYVRLGLRLRSDFQDDTGWSLLANLRQASVNRLGAEWDHSAEVGSDLRLASEFYQPLHSSGVIFGSPAVDIRRQYEGVYSNDQRVAEYQVDRLVLRADLGIQLRRYAELRSGPVWRQVDAAVSTGADELPDVSDHEAGWSASLTVDRLDRTIFPREGYRVVVAGETLWESWGTPESYEKAWGGLQQCASLGDHTLVVNGAGGLDFGNELPPYSVYRVGGENSFIGLADGELRASQFGAFGLAYRYRLFRLSPNLGRAAYLTTRADMGEFWFGDSDDAERERVYGAGLGLGLDTRFGPVYLGFGDTDHGDGRFYFSLGNVF